MFSFCFLVSCESRKGYSRGALLGPKSLDIFGVNPTNECQPCTNATASSEWLLYYPQQEGRRRFLNSMPQRYQCAGKKEAALTCHQLTEPMPQRFSCFPTQFRLHPTPNRRFCQVTKKHHTDISAKMSIVLLKLIK